MHANDFHARSNLHAPSGVLLKCNCRNGLLADQFEIKADVPGLRKQDIKLNVDADVLSISVDKSESKVLVHHH